ASGESAPGLALQRPQQLADACLAQIDPVRGVVGARAGHGLAASSAQPLASAAPGRLPCPVSRPSSQSKSPYVSATKPMRGLGGRVSPMAWNTTSTAPPVAPGAPDRK